MRILPLSVRSFFAVAAENIDLTMVNTVTAIPILHYSLAPVLHDLKRADAHGPFAQDTDVLDVVLDSLPKHLSDNYFVQFVRSALSSVIRMISASRR